AIIKGENIPKPGIPESFKVLLKELQSLGLDVKVLRDDNTEVEMSENIDYGDTDLRSIIEGDKRYNQEESYANYGYQKQEFKDNELVAVEEEEEELEEELEGLEDDLDTEEDIFDSEEIDETEDPLDEE
ncbi:MAG: hypothetical protein RR685_08475, partial [Hungatella sp.]